MEEKDKDLLLRDLCARLPYNVICAFDVRRNGILTYIRRECGGGYTCEFELFNTRHIDVIRPYLRPLSSLTQEERDKFCDIGGVISHRPSDGKLYLVAYFPEALDYLNSIHADYRGMIEKGLAIEVTEENNPYK